MHHDKKTGSGGPPVVVNDVFDVSGITRRFSRQHLYGIESGTDLETAGQHSEMFLRPSLMRFGAQAAAGFQLQLIPLEMTCGFNGSQNLEFTQFVFGT